MASAGPSHSRDDDGSYQKESDHDTMWVEQNQQLFGCWISLYSYSTEILHLKDLRLDEIVCTYKEIQHDEQHGRIEEIFKYHGAPTKGQVKKDNLKLIFEKWHSNYFQ